MEMLYRVSSFIIIPVLIFCYFPVQIRCESIKDIEYWADDVDKIHFATRKPFPWNKITVPNFLQLTDDDEQSDYKIFHTFLYVLLSISLLVVMYYCFKCCKCMKACAILMSSTSQSVQRNPVNVSRNARFNSTRVNRHHIGRRMGTEQRYERIRPELHSPRRNCRTTLELNLENRQANSLAVPSSDKPPDYSAVVLGDCSTEQITFLEVKPQNSGETPPPSYNENTFKLTSSSAMKDPCTNSG